jgi:hypothetical protein
MQQLQPGQARHHRRAEQQHDQHQGGWLLAHAAVAGGLGFGAGHSQLVISVNWEFGCLFGWLVGWFAWWLI